MASKFCIKKPRNAIHFLPTYERVTDLPLCRKICNMRKTIECTKEFKWMKLSTHVFFLNSDFFLKVIKWQWLIIWSHLKTLQ